MKFNKRQKITFIFLLLGLAVIVIPMWFEENIFSQHVSSILAKFPHLPNAPQFKSYGQSSSKQGNTAPDIIKPLMSAWVIEIFPYPKQVDLEGLILLLQSKGYSAFLQTDQSNHNHIFIGPEIDKNAAKQKCKRIIDVLHYKAQLKKYEVMKI